MADTPRKPYRFVEVHPVAVKHPPAPFPPRVAQRRRDGGGMTQSIDPRTPEGKAWLERMSGALKPAPPRDPSR